MPEQQWTVIETNVLIVANRKSDQANSACIGKCIELLVKVSDEASVVLDRGGEIFDEYSVYCDYSGEPGTGDEFFVWVHENKWTSCQLVSITPREDRGYEEFPDTPDLAKFDRSDRKFVATALTCTPSATIYNAVDSDWSHSALALAAVGVTVAELCPDCLKPAQSKS
jgi:hypothetical protein